MGDDRVERRALLGVGAGLLASLTGCSGLFVEPERTETPGGETPTPTSASTSTPTPTPTVTTRTDTPARTPSATRTAPPLPGDDIEIRNRRIDIERSQLERFATVAYRFDVENTGTRTIRDIEFRVRVRYEYEGVSRIVAVDYPRFWFDTDDDDEGLEADETERVTDQVRFERDGRAEDSTAVDRFDLELSVRRIRHR